MIYGDDRYKIIDCISCWYDLLGFGHPFKQANWNLNDTSCKTNFERLKSISTEFIYSLNLYGTNFYVNDGIASTIDIKGKEKDDIDKVLYFIESILLHFNNINMSEKRNNYPGIRGVVTAGQRVFYDVTNYDYNVMTKEITSYHPAEFQMNTAYSKAYIMEGSGSKAGLSGPHLYVDVLLYSVFQKMFDGIDGYSVEISEGSVDEYKVIVYANHEWFLKLYFDKEEIKYNENGIETSLYRLREYESYLDWYAKNHPSPLGRFIYDDDDE